MNNYTFFFKKSIKKSMYKKINKKEKKKEKKKMFNPNTPQIS